MPLFRSPAKLNLFLSVIGKRQDGYHELASLFQAIDLTDTLSIELSSEDRFTCSDPSLPLGQSNLVLKALALFRKKTGLHFPVEIHLEKKIPSEAGLGGGSSNAATTLFALNFLADHVASEEQLQEWAGEIGSDIAFFFSHGTAFCTGRGEQVRDLPHLEIDEVWVLKPSFGLPTPKVFACLELSNLPKRNLEACLEGFYKNSPEYFNDLEHAACHAEPALLAFKTSLSHAGFSSVHLTGSGTAFFCFGSGQIEHSGYFSKAKSIYRNRGSWY